VSFCLTSHFSSQFLLVLRCMNKPPSIFSLLLRRFFLLTLYGVFFFVQFFFNFRSDNNIISDSSNSYATVQTTAQKNFVLAKDHQHKKPGFRLNKRYQPTIVPSIFTPCEEIPVAYLNKGNVNKPDDYLLISFILAKSLRGPPQLS